MTSVTDLFCGMGGLSYGFSKNGFNVTGYDINKYCEDIFIKNKIGKFYTRNLNFTSINNETGLIDFLLPLDFNLDSDAIIGGPSCRPWSSVNITKREIRHPDYGLVESFFRIVDDNYPEFFLMENVPAIKNDPSYIRCISNIRKKYYAALLK